MGLLSMATDLDDFLPFSRLSAWFSCSVNPSLMRLWGKSKSVRFRDTSKVYLVICMAFYLVKHGGTLVREEDANYLFSDNSFTTDTVR